MTTRTINLMNASPSYEQFTYPAGEHQVRFCGRLAADHVNVIARIHSGDDIVKLALLKSAIGPGAKTRLILPYLPYSRADRRFSDGDCHGLETFGGLVNSMNFAEVVTMDAHNAKSARAHIRHLVDVQATPCIDDTIVNFAHKHGSKKITVLFPDEGAKVRYQMPRGIETNTDSVMINVAHCSKVRDPLTGKLSGFDVPSIHADRPALIVDDICDGGGTFLGIAQKITGVKLGLYVTHGIFSKGTAGILEQFDHLYTTNTIEPSDLTPLRMTVFDAMPYLLK